MTLPDVDLVISFRIASKHLSKQRAREQISKAERQYACLLDTLSKAGLRSVGRRGQCHDHILTFVSCPQPVIERLAKRELHSDFLCGISTASSDFEHRQLTPADRLRIIYAFVTSTHADGGLGVHPGSPSWDLVDSVSVVNDHKFNEAWIRSWTTHRITSVQIDKIREHFGDAVALYFHFLSAYTMALIFPAALGVIFHFYGKPYSPIYSALLLLWSIGFVEWWRIRERILAMRSGTRGSFRVEKRRARYVEGLPWWVRELRMASSVPVILLFITILTALLTAIFIFEAFVTQLYTGPGHEYISFGPTILFVISVPRVLQLHHASALRFTNWENHRHQSTHSSSLTLKIFTLDAVVAYLGLALSAFVYVPFGEAIMQLVQTSLFEGQNTMINQAKFSKALNDTNTTVNHGSRIWNTDVSTAMTKLKASRLQEQMFAYTVTNQVTNAFTEIGMPFVQRGIDSLWNRWFNGASKDRDRKKHVSFEDEKKAKIDDEESEKEKEFLDNIRRELALPDYESFEDYSEMVTQFGYVALWSTIWPLAPVMALINNVLESRSDAIKIAVHHRRPIPVRTDTIGPWLDTMSFLTWLAALTNSALVYLYGPYAGLGAQGFQIGSSPGDNVGTISFSARRRMLGAALLIALAASHGYIVVRAVVRHVLERAMWDTSAEVAEMEGSEKALKEKHLSGLGDGEVMADSQDAKTGEGQAFWQREEGLGEIQKLLKEA